MAKFELMGGHMDETRLVVEASCGFSLALVGQPWETLVVPGPPKYDACFALKDVKIEHGFRLDVVSTLANDTALAVTMAQAYAMNRTSAKPTARPWPPNMLAPGVAAAASAVYPLREPANDPMVEQVVVLVQPRPDPTAYVLFHTSTFRTEEVNQIFWAHARAAILDQYHWDMRRPRVQPAQVWPPSAITMPKAKLTLTDAAFEEAKAKSTQLGPLAPAQVDALTDALRSFAMTDYPPSMEVIPPMLGTYAQRLAAVAPIAAATFTRNLGQVRTMHDLRGWVWQCIWAMGNRPRTA